MGHNHRVPAASGPRSPACKWREVFVYIQSLYHSLIINFLRFCLYCINVLNMLPFQIEAPALYHLFLVTSSTVMNRIQRLSSISLPHFITDIPHATLEWIHDFVEIFVTDNDIPRMKATIPVGISTDIFFLLEYLYDTLIKANYIPSYLTNEYSSTLQFLSATAVNEHVSLQPPPKEQ